MAETVDYEKFGVEELEKLVAERDITIENGSGKDGTIIKADLVKALQDYDTEHPDQPKPVVEEEEDEELRFSLERLTGKDAYELTGFAPHIVAGALVGETRQSLTIPQVKAACRKWLGTEVS